MRICNEECYCYFWLLLVLDFMVYGISYKLFPWIWVIVITSFYSVASLLVLLGLCLCLVCPDHNLQPIEFRPILPSPTKVETYAMVGYPDGSVAMSDTVLLPLTPLDSRPSNRVN